MKVLISEACRKVLDIKDAPLPAEVAEKLTAEGLEHGGTFHSAARAMLTEVERRKMSSEKVH